MKNLIKLDTAEQRKDFIQTTEPGVYTGLNVDDEEIMVLVDSKAGMIVKTIHTAKPNWYEVVYYDEDGYQEGVTYEHIQS